MTVQRMIELLKIEHECMLRGAHDDCDRDCANCELVQDDSELHEMYTSVISLLEERKSICQKLWSEFHAEEDELEKQFVRTAKHDDWFFVYRPWLQKGFEIAIKAIAKQEDK